MGYDDQYESKLIRGDQDPLPWNLAEVISNYLAISDMILDIGCGTAFKLLQFSDSVRWIYGLEPNEKMLSKATKNINQTKVSNITLVRGRCEKVPFVDDIFDVVTCMVAPHDTGELYRVLRPGGYAILEKVG
ncbi:MAG TPA: class I SAM-dependent methyltransferase, partial [Bacteroidetes bacterium]|nr:class I SAM-dependent methyltransferase [Bacteroidota bacterium]